MSKVTHPSTQSHINISRIQDGVVITKDGGLRMVILVSAVNFALKRDEEQNALIYQYQNFLNSLTFSIQIVIQSRQLDLTGYLAKLDARLAAQTNELLQIQTADYIDFVKRMISIANIMDKKFFIVVPYNPVNLAKRSFFDKLIHPNKTAPDIGALEFKQYREELLQRINVIMSGLSPLGLRSIPLDTQQLIELYYQTFNPEEGGKERLTNEELLVSPLIEGEIAQTPVAGGNHVTK
jgi:type IV secretory pathway VirB4 component